MKPSDEIRIRAQSLYKVADVFDKVADLKAVHVKRNHRLLLPAGSLAVVVFGTIREQHCYRDGQGSERQFIIHEDRTGGVILGSCLLGELRAREQSRILVSESGWAEHPALTSFVHVVSMQQARRYKTQYVDACSRTVLQRLRDLRKAVSGSSLKYSITDMAGLLGCSREQASKSMKKLEDENASLA